MSKYTPVISEGEPTCRLDRKSKVKKKIHLVVKKANLKFCLDILVHHEDIRVKIFSDFFDSANLFTVRD